MKFSCVCCRKCVWFQSYAQVCNLCRHDPLLYLLLYLLQLKHGEIHSTVHAAAILTSPQNSLEVQMSAYTLLHLLVSKHAHGNTEHLHEQLITHVATGAFDTPKSDHFDISTAIWNISTMRIRPHAG